MQQQPRRLLASLLALSLTLGLGGAIRPVGAAASTHPAPRMGPQTTLPAVAWLRGTSGQLALGVTTALTDATWTQQAILTSTTQLLNDGYGDAVALSGNTAVVAAPATPEYPSPSYGAVYIFTRTASGVWSQQAELLDPQYGQGHDDKFGTAVALQGNTLVVGAIDATGAYSYSGAAYVYGRTGAVWRLQATLRAGDAAYNDAFGGALALSGATIAVGDFGKNNSEGAVYIYVDSNGTWRPQAELTYPGRYLFAFFGNAVALWSNTLLVAAPQAQAAFVYARSGTTWRLQSLLTAPHAPRNFFGEAVALQGDTALVGACCALTGNPNGAVYVYTRSGSTWSLQATLRSPGGINDSFGSTVSLNYHTAVVGNGGAYVFVGSGATWSEQAPLIPSDRPPQDVGFAVAVQGNTALVAATGAAPPAGPEGYVFTRSGADWTTGGTAGVSRPRT